MSVVADLTGNVLKTEDTGVLVIPYEFTIATGITTTAGSTTIFVMPSLAETFQVAGATVTFSTAGGSGAAITVNIDTGTQAPGAGTAQLTGTMALTGAANTPVNGTVITTPTNITSGARISYTTSGTLTGLAGCVLTVLLKRTV